MPAEVLAHRMDTRSGARLDGGRLVALGAALALGVFFWDSPVLWPLKILVVMMHESGHALASLLVGGTVDHITLAADQSGACLSRLPPGALGTIVVYSAGYVGSALAGAGMLLATFRYRLRRAVTWTMALWLTVMAVLYVRDLFTALFITGCVVALAAIARFLPDAAVELLNLFVAAFSALYVLFDLRDDLWDHRVRSISDAALLAEQTWIPAVIWAVIWTLFSLAILGAAFWLSVATPLSQNGRGAGGEGPQGRSPSRQT